MAKALSMSEGRFNKSNTENIFEINHSQKDKTLRKNLKIRLRRKNASAGWNNGRKIKGE